jgi:predicted DNA-binding protein (MmcQ/YjbR family)
LLTTQGKYDTKLTKTLNTIELDGTMPPEETLELIEHYERVVAGLTKSAREGLFAQ